MLTSLRTTRRALAAAAACILVALAVASTPAAARPAAQDGPRYDVVLAGGRVIDPESGLDAVRNVGIVGDRIAAIEQEALDGAVVIDARGLVVSPGFIDLHAHGQSEKGNEYQARDGVTTALEMESGVPDLDLFLHLRENRAILNYGATVSHEVNRTRAMPQHAEAIERALASVQAGGETAFLDILDDLSVGNYEPLVGDQLDAMLERLDSGIRRGALGIGMPHQYYPGADHAEIFRVFQFAGERAIPVYTHVREMGISAIQEVIADAVATGTPLHIVHLNSMSLWDIETNLALVAGAREHGVDVTTEAYPYTAASTFLESSIFDAGWDERLRISYGDLQWQDTGERLTEETFREYRAKGGVVIIHMMKPEWIEAAMRAPFVMIASDGMPYAPGAHPRSAGTFARVLGRYVREQGVMSLPDAIARMTIMPARRLEPMSPAMSRKGRIQVGADADITIFDPATVLDTATFEGGLSYSEGIRHVLVNGTFVVRDGESVPGAHPGRPVLGKYRGH